MHSVRSLPLIAIIGSTGVGKTSFSYTLAKHLDNKAVIINGDMAQLYSGLSIGTAKPTVTHTPLAHYLFDYCTNPTSYNVAAYRKKVEEIIHQTTQHPIVVGGSTLYMHSLFFDYHATTCVDKEALTSMDAMDNQQLWAALSMVDPLRATQIHPNDRYRLYRALMIVRSGKKASSQKPSFKPLAPTVLIHLTFDKQELKKRLAKRITDMFADGWIQEVESLLTTQWQKFWEQKKIIGYSSVASFIKKESTISFEQLQEHILVQTMQYVKKQEKYWRTLKKSLLHHDHLGKQVILHTLNLTLSEPCLYLEQITESIALLQRRVSDDSV